MKEHQGVPVISGSLKLKSKLKLKADDKASLKNQPSVIKKSRNKTAAEIAFEKAHSKKQAEKLSQLAKKSHKEKVAEFNEYLGKLSEHHDIPKVGPG